MPGHVKPIGHKYYVPAYHYTDELQNALKCKVKAEPWLHIGIRPINTGKTMAIVYCIWVWDTREVVGTGVVDMKVCRSVVRVSRGPGHVTVKSKPAIDDNEPLHGGDFIASAFSKAMSTCKSGIYASPEFDIDKLNNAIATEASGSTYDVFKQLRKAIIDMHKHGMEVDAILKALSFSKSEIKDIINNK